LSSLQAAATINAGLHHHRSPEPVSPRHGIERGRSGLMNNFALNDPSIPAPGEMQPTNNHRPHSANGNGRRRSSILTLSGTTADPHHHRQPSLGELHQELEAETEGQVNRLLHMIRLQQDQLSVLQNQNHPQDSSAIAATSPYSAHPNDQSTSRSGSFSSTHHAIFNNNNRQHSLSRQSSTRISNANSISNSPALRPASSNNNNNNDNNNNDNNNNNNNSNNLGPLNEYFYLGVTRDDAAFYQAETQMLTRENQMLKFRVRELGEFPLSLSQRLSVSDALRFEPDNDADYQFQTERQIADLSPSAHQHSHSPLADGPSFASELAAALPAAGRKGA
jgi:hypothetical protein